MQRFDYRTVDRILGQEITGEGAATIVIFRKEVR